MKREWEKWKKNIRIDREKEEKTHEKERKKERKKEKLLE